MEFRTQVAIPEPPFHIEPCEEILFVGSCFADAIGQRFRDEAFPVTVNPYGVMYNPASILHTLQRLAALGSVASAAGGSASSGFPAGSASAVSPRIAFLTLGTNHVYRLKATGEIVDNCEKRPAALFQEEVLSVDQCADYLRQSVDLLRSLNPDIHIVLTVSPIRYRKYGYHESQLSKATLLLAIEKILNCQLSIVNYQLIYFPAYELILDELRDYRFYAPDMLHPSAQAVDYIWERLVDSYFSPAAKDYLAEWRPLRQALAHKPFNADSPEYRAFHEQTQQRLAAFRQKYPASAVSGFPADAAAAVSSAPAAAGFPVGSAAVSSAPAVSGFPADSQS